MKGSPDVSSTGKNTDCEALLSMAFYESLTVEQLERALTISKWVLAVFGVLFAIAGVANQWLSSRISTLQETAKATAQERVGRTQQELEATKAKVANLEARVRPPTTAERLMKLCSAVDSRFPSLINEGKRDFKMQLPAHDFGVLKEIAREDSEHRVQIETSTNTIIGPEGSMVQVRLVIGDSVFAAPKGTTHSTP